MRMSGRVAVVAACSVLAASAPASGQFGGFGALKKKLESAVKELEKPESKPPTPTAPEQSDSTPPSGGYAAPRPKPNTIRVDRTEQVVVPSTQPAVPVSGGVQSGGVQTVLATEVFRCRGESDGAPRKLQLEYLQSRSGVRSGRFIETTTFIGASGKETEVEIGTFRFAGADYNLSYKNPEFPSLKLQVSQMDRDNGWTARAAKFDPEFPELDDARNLIEYISPQRERDAEEAGGDTNAISCELVKPIFATESFEDYSIGDPDSFPEPYDGEPALPQFAGRDSQFRIVRTMLTEAVKNHWDQPKFAKYYIAVEDGKWGGWYGYLVDMRSGKVSNFFDGTIDGGMMISYAFRENSKLLLSITVDNEKDYCRLNYSKFVNEQLVTFKHEILGKYASCANEYGTSVKEGYLQDIERTMLGE